MQMQLSRNGGVTFLRPRKTEYGEEKGKALWSLGGLHRGQWGGRREERGYSRRVRDKKQGRAVGSLLNEQQEERIGGELGADSR
jgi:hypothetical protein